MIRVFEAFAGYGTQSIALDRLNKKEPTFNYEIVGISEIDNNAIKAYNILHKNVPNFGDICKIDWCKVPDFDLFTYSFPCTNISLLGNKLGLKEGSGTQSSLLWECKRAIENKRPKYLLMENVKALTFKNNIKEFEKWIDYLKHLGYSNYYKVLNAKDYGIPQNRERVFMVSILDENNTFQFPQSIQLNIKFSDLLEDNVSSKYYPKKDKNNNYTRKALITFLKNYKISIDKKVCIDLHNNNSINDTIIPTITTRTFGAGNTYFINNGIIRKPTERELFRFMGLEDEEIDKLLLLNFSVDKYCKLAGNSIVVNVLESIFKRLFITKEIKEKDDGTKTDTE